MGRPRKDEAERAVQMHLPRWAFDLLDQYMRGRAAAALATMGETTGPTARELAAGRSAYVAKLIWDALGFDARYPVSVKVLAPVHGGASEWEAAAKWMREAEAELNESAPAPVKAALEANRTMHAARAEAKGAGAEEEASILRKV